MTVLQHSRRHIRPAPAGPDAQHGRWLQWGCERQTTNCWHLMTPRPAITSNRVNGKPTVARLRHAASSSRSSVVVQRTPLAFRVLQQPLLGNVSGHLREKARLALTRRVADCTTARFRCRIESASLALTVTCHRHLP